MLPLTTLYETLRAQILSRHYALGRYFRADHLSFANHLGVVQESSLNIPNPQPVTQNNAVHGCLWSDAEVIQPTTVYNTAMDLLALGEDPPAGNGQRTFERWRIGDHDRINPLLYSGQLMVCLAVETVLGIAGSKDILTRLLGTMKTLFKFSNPPYDGYILRWDAVTSDRWETYADKNNKTQLDHCCEFLTDSSVPGGYLYCTPLDDPRYVPYMKQSDFDKLPSQAEKDSYQQRRKVSVDRLRYWEPSMDELTGLLTGYSFVYSVVSDPAIQAEITDQVKRIANYLASNAYLLVRPGGGFCAQGASGMTPALEFPFGRIFSRICGSKFASTTNFEGALKNAELWPKFSSAFGWATVAGVAAGIVVLWGLVVSGSLTFVAAVLPAILTAVAGGTIGKALVLYFNSELFDVKAWPGPANGGDKPNNDQQKEFWWSYLLGQLPSKARFQAWLTGASHVAGGYAQNFPPFLGLSAINDSDQTVGSGFLGWFNARGGRTRAPGVFPLPSLDASAPGFDDGQNDFATNIDPFATAVAVNLGAGHAAQIKLVRLLTDVSIEFSTNQRINELAIFANDGLPTYDLSVSYVTESVRPALNYMAALALAWYFSKTQSDAGNPLPVSLGFPTPPAGGTVFATAAVPLGVLNAPDPEEAGVLVPASGLPGDLPPGSDLFSGAAPSKPANPPPPVTISTWFYTGATSHSGSWTGDNGTDTINGGQMVTGAGCQILGVLLQLVDKHGDPLDPTGASYATQQVGGPAVGMGSWPFAASAQIVSVNFSGNAMDETVVIGWQYSTGRAIRYRVGYLIQGNNCGL